MNNNKIGYGGTAINNLLSEQDRFYNFTKEIPDYDFFSTNAKQDAMELVDILHSFGFKKSFLHTSTFHEGTFKVYVGKLAVADISNVNKSFFSILEQGKVMDENGMWFAPINYLRMDLVKELSRPEGNTKRWGKVAKRLALLNKNHPSLLNKDKSDQEFCLAFSENQQQQQQQQQQQHYFNSQHKKILDLTRAHMKDKDAIFMPKITINMNKKRNHNSEKNVGNSTSTDTSSLHYKFSDDYVEVIVLNISDAITGLRKKLTKENPLLRVNYIYNNNEYSNNNGIIGNRDEDKVVQFIEIQLVYNQTFQHTIAYVYRSTACSAFELKTVDTLQNIKVATTNTMMDYYLGASFNSNNKNLEKHEMEKNRMLCSAHWLMPAQAKDQERQHRLMELGATTPCQGIETSDFLEIMGRKRKLYAEYKQEIQQQQQQQQQLDRKYNDMFFCYSPKPQPLSYCLAKLQKSYQPRSSYKNINASIIFKYVTSGSFVVLNILFGFILALLSIFGFRKEKHLFNGIQRKQQQ
eukprot:Pgem_evm1s20198